jgi:hypothetical protein
MAWEASMARIEIGDAATAGIRLTFRKPLTVLAWGLLTCIYVAILLALFGGGLIAAIQTLARTPAGAANNDANVSTVFALIGSVMGLAFFLWIGLWVINSAIMCAAIRAELEPEPEGFAYLRFGRRELWMMAVTLVFYLVVAMFQFVISIPVLIVQSIVNVAMVGGMAANNRADLGMMGPALALSIVGQIVILGATAWLWLRLCLGPVLSFRDREFRLFESWALTRGHVGRMFLVVLVIAVMIFVFYLVLYAVLGAGAFAYILTSPELKDFNNFFKHPATDWLRLFGPLLALAFIGAVLVTGVVNATIWTSVARMYRQLTPDADVAANFT